MTFFQRFIGLGVVSKAGEMMYLENARDPLDYFW